MKGPNNCLAAVVAALALAAGCSSSGSDAADAEGTAAAAVTSTTVAESTTTTDPGPQEGDEATPEDLKEAIVEGSFLADRTIVETNLGDEGPAGSVAERSYTMSTECGDDGKCTVTMVNHSADDIETEFELVDGKFAVQLEEPSSCVLDDGTEYAVGSIGYRSDIEYRITAAEHRGGRWIATAFEGESTFDGVVLDETSWAVENCPWTTEDGNPARERWSVKAELTD